MRQRPPRIVGLLAAVTLAAGLVNLLSVLGPTLPERLQRVDPELPLTFLDVSRYATLLAGFALVVASIHVYRRKRRAWGFVVGLASVSTVLHLVREPDVVGAASSLVLLGLAWFARDRFLVRSRAPDPGAMVLRVGLGFLAALIYGVVGFWILDHRDFRIDFTIGDAVHRTLLVLSVLGDPDVEPHTRYARWFLRSLRLMTFTAFGYSALAFFRPVAYRLRVVPRRRDRARAIVERHGRSSLDYFKLWPDKTIEFFADGTAFVAYRVGAGVALALGDPVCPEEAMEAVARGFLDLCDVNDWQPAFHQTLPDFLPVYQELGLRKLKIGDEAAVELGSFTLDGKRMKEVRNRINRFHKDGVTIRVADPPLDGATLNGLEAVSDAWLTIEGRRERQFTLGRFERDYVRGTPAVIVEDSNGRTLAFLNVIPSYRAGETTIDMMRHSPDAPRGVMDFLLARHLLAMKDAGYERFSLGMTPMSGFQDGEESAAEERALHALFQHLNFLFSFRGLRQYKAKFASIWEPRYLIYGSRLDLPRLAMAIRQVSEIPSDRRRL